MYANIQDVQNVTDPHTTMATTEKPYDGEGAMKFTIAVVMVYGVAVMGVFIMGYYGRRRHETHEMDRQASTFLKNIDQIRFRMKKEKQVDHTSDVLRRTSFGGFNYKERNSLKGLNDLGRNMAKYMALPIFMAQGADDSGVELRSVQESSNADSATGSAFSASERTGSCANSTILKSNTDTSIVQKLEIVEEAIDEDLDDNVFMTDEERQKYGVDFYVGIKESDIC
ncbi:hypothetical protein FSP39_000653 [Pinctada imbricata]|uniref:Uncharacterized protein n=1 Tax=Pinctada imbricata TaxID=66713 RepID=A0AA88XNZ6_PINIB|nr:hypothetical protein FSP39_000653 [Pinctada imbricata]